MLLPNNIILALRAHNLNFKTSYVITKLLLFTVVVMQKRISKHHMLLPNPGLPSPVFIISLYFKTSYVITKLVKSFSKAFLNIISKHHMLLPNPRF